ncbi:MAG: sigma-70 family RNA polymerase sigma factor [Acidobacteria bacterium]|nr:sigma-70 family RNA polymerase sigma factor [Acidobacteriota bacterium]
MAGRPHTKDQDRTTDPKTSPEPASREPPPTDPITELLQVLKPRLKTILARFRIPRQDAEDVLQDSLLLLVRRHAGLRDPAAYLLSTLQYRCHMYWRHRRRDRLLDIGDQLLEHLAPPMRAADQAAVEARRDLGRQLATLEPGARRLVLLRYALGYTNRETARRLGLPHDSVRQRARYARNLLARRLAAADRPEESSPCPDAPCT